MKHIIRVIALIILVTIIIAGLLSYINLLPPQASAEARPIDWLFGMHIQVIAFLFALIMVFMIYSIVVFRRKPGETGDGAYIHGHTTLEIVWTIVPLAIVVYFGYLGAITLNDITSPVEDELIVNVTSLQWAWRFDYPEADISSVDLNLPLGRTILLHLESNDVIHSFWVPEFRVKQDAVPGMVKELRFTPTEVGSYKLRCAELCGLSHAYMLGNVNVLPAAEFEDWIKQEQLMTSASPAERGSQTAQLQGCLGCHTVDGNPGIGPTWLGLYGKEETLEDGTTVTVDEAYLHHSIVEPNAQIVQGFPANVMPQHYGDGETISEEQIQDIITYIQSLSNGAE